VTPHLARVFGFVVFPIFPDVFAVFRQLLLRVWQPIPAAPPVHGGNLPRPPALVFRAICLFYHLA
jgi:hypothetical protein